MSAKVADDLFSVIIAVMGWVASFLLDENHSWVRLWITIFTSWFTGFLVMLYCREAWYSENITGILCWVSWLSWAAVLKLLKAISLKFVKDKVEKVLDRQKLE